MVLETLERVSKRFGDNACRFGNTCGFDQSGTPRPCKSSDHLVRGIATRRATDK